LPALAAQQHVNAPVAIAHPRLGDFLDPLAQDGLGRRLPLYAWYPARSAGQTAGLDPLLPFEIAYERAENTRKRP
jgi:hypothetical protein